MKTTFGRQIWLLGILVAGLSFAGCSGGSGELEDPLVEDEGFSNEDIDAVLDEMRDESYGEESLDEDYADAAPFPEEPGAAESYIEDAGVEAAPSEDWDPAASGEDTAALMDQLDPVSNDDVESYKLDDETADHSYQHDEQGHNDAMEEPLLSEHSHETAVEEPAGDSGARYTESFKGIRYITKPGDTLAVIAAKIYGDGTRWHDLANRNNITNPSAIYPGDVIEFDVDNQTRGFANELSQMQMQTVVVEHGDTLSGIAKRVLGDANAWKYIWRFNEDKISNPDVISVGQVVSFIPIDGMTGVANTGSSRTLR